MRNILICLPIALFPLAWSPADAASPSRVIVTQVQAAKGMKSFANKLIREFARTYPDRKMRYEPEQGRLVDANSGLIINLANFYAEYKSLPIRDRREFIRGVVREFRGMEDETPPLDQVRARLTPKVWSRGKWDWMALDGELRGGDGPGLPQAPLAWKLGDHLQGVLAIDGDKTIQYVNQGMLEDWKVSGGELVPVAEARLKNLGEGWSVMGTGRADGGEGRFMALMGDPHFAASHLFEGEMLKRLDLAEGTLAAAPSEETLLIVEPGDAKLDALFLEQIKKDYESGQSPLCPIPLVYRGGKWETWTAPAGHPQKVAFDNLERLYFAGEYEQQKQQLDLLHTAKGLEVFVASYSLYEGEPGGGYFSMAIWTKSVDTFLPKTDYVAFVDVERPDDQALLGRLPWSTFMEHFGGHVTRDTDRYMPRYRTSGYPDVDRIKALSE